MPRVLVSVPRTEQNRWLCDSTVHIVREDEDRLCWTKSCGFKRGTQLVSEEKGIESLRHWCGESLVK